MPNLLTWSNGFLSTPWYFGTGGSYGALTQNNYVAPEGNLTAWLFTEDSTTHGHLALHQYLTNEGAGSQTYTFQIYVKRNGRDIYLQMSDHGPNAAFAILNLATQTVYQTGYWGSGWSAVTAGVTTDDIATGSSGNGWYLAWITATCPSMVNIEISLDTANISAPNKITYLGDGVSGFYLFGAQLQIGPSPGTYVPIGAAGDAAYILSLTHGTFTSTGTTLSSTYEPPLTPVQVPAALSGAQKCGVNIAGGEYAPGPGVVNTNYIYPSTEELDYFKAKGFSVIRLPFDQYRLQHPNFAPLDTAELGRIQTVVEYCRKIGLWIILDVHTYGQMWAAATANYQPIGGAAISTNAFVNFWTRVATRFQNYPNVMYGLMNEPNVQSPAAWAVIARAAVAGIRTITSTQTILIPGSTWTTAATWVSGGNGAQWQGYVDPVGGPFYFEMHQYFDATYSGQGGDCTVGSGHNLDAATSWLTTYGFKGFLGEFDYWPSAQCTIEVPTFMSVLHDHPNQWAGWTWWDAGQWVWDTGVNLDPNSMASDLPNGDAPQTPILLAYLPAGNSPTAYSLAAATGIFTRAGAPNVMRLGKKLPGASGIFNLVGTDGTTGTIKVPGSRGFLLGLSAIGSAPLAGAGGQISVQVQSYSATGLPGVFVAAATAIANLQIKFLVPAGVYGVTGRTSQTSKGFRLTGNTGVFSKTGTAIAARIARKLIDSAGSFTVTGIGFAKKEIRLAAAPGIFAKTGLSITALTTRRSAVATGVFTKTGSTLKTTRGTALLEQPGVFAETGHTGAYGRSFSLSLSPGAFTTSLGTASFLTARYCGLATGVFAKTGLALALRKGVKLVELPAAIAIAGNSAKAAFGLPGATGVFAATASTALAKTVRKAGLTSGAFATAGNAIAGRFGYKSGAITTVSFACAAHTALGRFGHRLPAAPGAFTTSPHAISVKFGFLAAPGAFNVTWHDGTPLVTSTGHYYFSSDPGVFGYSGHDIAVKARFYATGAVGAFAKTGSSLKIAFSLPGATGVFSATAHTAPLTAKRRLAGDTGHIVETGSPLALPGHYQFVAPTYHWVISGTAALHATHLLAGATGHFTEAGHTGIAGYGGTATFSFALTGRAATTKVAKKLAGATGVFSATGRAAKTNLGNHITAGTGTFAKTGSDLNMGRGQVLITGHFAEAGGVAGFTITNASTNHYSLAGNTGVFIATPIAAIGKRAVRMWNAAGGFAATGKTSKMHEGFHFVEAPGVFTKTGGDAHFPTGPSMSTIKGQFGIYGNSAKLSVGHHVWGDYGLIAVTGVYNNIASSITPTFDPGVFKFRGHDATFSFGYSYVGPFLNRVQIPNDRFPVDLLLFRVNGNVEIPGYVESTFEDVQMPNPNDDNNLGLAWYGPFPMRGTAVKFIKPSPTKTLKPQVNLFS